MLVMERFEDGSPALPPHPGLEALEDGFCMVDREWRITYWNLAAERMLRLPRGRVLGRSLWQALPFLTLSGTADQLRRVQRERLPQRFLQSRPGKKGVASVYAAPLPDGGLAMHFRDATDEVKRAEQYAVLLESIRDGFVAVDERWRIVYLNSVAESLLRLSRDRAVGASIWSLLPDDPPEISHALHATMQDGMQRHLRSVRPEGRVFRGRIFDLWMYPLAGGGISLFFEDVSETIRRESELARLAVEAQEANQAKSRFFAAISHELRTPLNAIVGYTHLLNSETYGAMPEAARRAAGRAGICAEHLARLVDDVLLLTTAEISRLPVVTTPVYLQEYLPIVTAPLQLQAQAKQLAFSLSIPSDLPAIETDPQRLRQLLIALLSNAVKFTHRGSITVQVALRAAEGEPGGQVEITVTDTGPGVAEEHRERIFGPFEQLGDPSRSESMTQGSGLGLTIARKLAQLLGGKLYLAASSSGGSCFCLALPLRFTASE